MNPQDEHALKVAYAKDAGYNDAKYDGIYYPEALPCRCEECIAAYDAAQAKAVDEIFASRGLS